MDYTLIADNRPLWAILISLAAAVLIMLSSKRPNLRESWTIIAATGKAVIVFSMLPLVLSGKILESTPLYIAEGIHLHFRADPTGILFAALASFLWLITSFYTIGYMRSQREEHQTSFYACFAVCLSATMGIAFAANLLTFFVFYEILAIATYPLVIHKRNDEAVRAGRKYLVYALVAGQLFLVAIVWTQIISGDASFQAGGFLAGKASPLALQAIFVLMILGAAVKAGIMPLHGWLPSAMVAPTPVSALLHAVAVVNAGVFAVIRIVGFVFGPRLLSEIGMAAALAWVASFTIIVSSLIALRQDNLKKRLAYSTVSQLSYMILGTCLLTPLGMMGGLFYMTAHSFMKITLFFCAGAIYATHHLSEISEMKGIGLKMPYTMAAFTIGSLGISGLPFIVGFVGKWNIALGALQGGKGIFIAVLIGSALLSLSYFMPIVYMAFFQRPNETSASDHHELGVTNGGAAVSKYQEVALIMLIPLLLTTAFSLFLGVFPNLGAGFYDLASMAANSITGGNLTGGGW